MRLFYLLAAAFVFLFGFYYISNNFLSRSPADLMETGFQHVIVDRNGPFNPWGKGTGDINGDGLVDLIVGGHYNRAPYLYEKILRKLGIDIYMVDGGELVWYESPAWKKHVIAKGIYFSTDIEIVDMDGDGDNDVICITDKEVLWFRNPDWTPTVIDTEELHDIEIGDFDKDGNIDIIGRNQSAFGGQGEKLFFYYQLRKGLWKKNIMSCPKGEGLKAADINGDGLLDVVVNGKWYENSGEPEASRWKERVYSRSWEWPHTAISVGDVNGDRRPDIILTPSEKAGMSYRISWFEAPKTYEAEWREHIVEDNVECVYHFSGTADMDMDGDIDILTAKMFQGTDPDEVKMYVNDGDGKKWTKRVLSNMGSHNIRMVDIDGDGDIDLFGANWAGDYQAIEIWVNQICRWERHLIDKKKPWRAIFITSADIDGDGYKDIITGGWWYRNPGKPSGTWERREIGRGANNMAAVFDFDGDGNMDVLSTNGKTDYTTFVWARNDGRGTFEIFNNIPGGRGDFLQGIAIGEYTPGKKSAAVSWHAPDKGIQMLTIPEFPESQPWVWRNISGYSQDEELNTGDIDGDGVPDLLLGTRWLRNDGDTWALFPITSTGDNPDRNRLVDINRDGRLDAVVGFEAISTPGKVVWYEQGEIATAPWNEHVIGTCIGPMSLDVADMDHDGDLDVVVGEHNLAKPEEASLYVFLNADGKGIVWEKELVSVGDEHHDGAHVVDIDGDGDNDIVSIGWGHSKVILYENRCEKCRNKLVCSPS